MSGGNNLLPNAAVTVHPLPGGWSLQRAALVQPGVLIEATSGVVQITKIPNDQLVAMEAQVYKGGGLRYFPTQMFGGLELIGPGMGYKSVTDAPL